MFLRYFAFYNRSKFRKETGLIVKKLKMKKQKCVIIIDADRIGTLECEIIRTICSLCDVKFFYLPGMFRRKIPFSSKSKVRKVNELLSLHKDIPSCSEYIFNESEKIDFIFSFSTKFERNISLRTPVIYISNPDTSGIAVLKGFIRGDSFINVGLAVCYKNIHYTLSEAKLKMDICFFKKNFSFLKQVFPDICVQSINLLKKNFDEKKVIPVINRELKTESCKFYHVDLFLCYFLMPFRLLKKIMNFLCYWEQWHVGIVNDNIEKVVSSGFKIDKVIWLPPVEKHQFIADPFGIKYNNRLYIFAEFWDSTRPVGKIVWSDESDSFKNWNTFLDHDTHLSYPFLFREGKKIYCTPESAEQGDFKLYTAERFPDKWNKGEVLFRDFRMADASLLFYKNKYWLFAAKASGDSAFELCIWFSDKINGKWKAHPMNPVKRDITSARPAGPPFIYKNTIYRPAQDCSDSYGSRIVMNRVSVLSETDFREGAAGVVKGPDSSPYPDGMHTLSVIDDVVVIDAKRKVFTLFNFRILSYKIKRVLTRIYSQKL